MGRLAPRRRYDSEEIYEVSAIVHPDEDTRPLRVVNRHPRDVRVTSALPPIADIRRMSWNVRFVPKADLTSE